MGVSPLAPAGIILAIALRAILPRWHSGAALLLIGACAVGAVSADQRWAQLAWGAVTLASLLTLLIRSNRERRAGQVETTAHPPSA